MTFRTLLLGQHDQRTLERIHETLELLSARGRRETLDAATPGDLRVLWDLVGENPAAAANFFDPRDDATIRFRAKSSRPVLSHLELEVRRQGEAVSAAFETRTPLGATRRRGLITTQTDADETSHLFVQYTPNGDSLAEDLAQLMGEGDRLDVRPINADFAICRAFSGQRPLDRYVLLLRQG